MRALTLTVVCLTCAQVAQAQAAPTEIILSTATMSGEVSGMTLPDKPVSFFVRSPARGDITVSVAADNSTCGFEMQRSSSAAFQSDLGSFPASRTFQASEGETFTFSFFQTRTAYMAQKGCSFTLSVN